MKLSTVGRLVVFTKAWFFFSSILVGDKRGEKRGKMTRDY